MHHHEPFVADALEHVGGEHLGLHGAVVTALGKVFLDHQHREIAGHDDVDIANVEAHFEHALENALPTLHHRPPTGQLAPSGMDADDLAILEPDLLHLLEVEALEGAIKISVRFYYGVVVGHFPLNASMFVQPSRRAE